ncbi:MAG: FAD-binding oxidoreductase [Halobacteriovoraceae bacterium]|jgi:hypothetical protein|nr:FAD-binding oxidoreductase [Halobacteriovoraceae bacterium]MBT5094151.1 FAD-binding oxidoreductase [Halobacteriovoraceae bacterium]
METKSDYDVIVIGDGITANSFLLEYSKYATGQKVLQIHEPLLAPPTSMSSTATITLQGVKKGVGALGDILMPAYESICDFIEKEAPDGVTTGLQYHLDKPDGPTYIDLKRRYSVLEEVTKITDELRLIEPCYGKVNKMYFIAPSIYLKWFRDKVSSQKRMNLTKRLEFVVGLDEKNGICQIELKTGEVISADKIFYAGGVYSSLLNFFRPESTARIRPGQFIEFVGVNWGSDSFCLSYLNYNLIYRSIDNRLLIGATNHHDGAFLGHEKELWGLVEEFEKLIGVENLKSNYSWKVVGGLRMKRRKRIPMWGKAPDFNNIYTTLGLYKNGFSLSQLAAVELTKEFIGKDHL